MDGISFPYFQIIIFRSFLCTFLFLLIPFLLYFLSIKYLFKNSEKKQLLFFLLLAPFFGIGIYYLVLPISEWANIERVNADSYSKFLRDVYSSISSLRFIGYFIFYNFFIISNFLTFRNKIRLRPIKNAIFFQVKVSLIFCISICAMSVFILNSSGFYLIFELAILAICQYYDKSLV